MTHEERLALIYKPMPWRVQSFANVIAPAYRWGGVQKGVAADLLSGRTADELHMTGLTDFELLAIAEKESREATAARERATQYEPDFRARVIDALDTVVDANTKRTGAGKRISPLVWEAIADNLVLGASNRETARRVGCHVSTVRRVRARHGITHAREMN